MYPNFDNKQDRSSKREALLTSIERDQRLEAMKREAYANAIWATDSEESKTKDATETGDTLTRIVAAMKAAASSSDKPNPNGFKSVGDLYDAMGDTSSGVFSENVNNSASATDTSAPAADAPMLEEPILNEVMVEEKREPDEPKETIDSGKAQRGISIILRKYDFLSNINFEPVIIKDGQIQDHNYIVRHTDGKIALKNGTAVPSDNELLQYVDWEKTYLSIKDKTESFAKLHDGIRIAMMRPLFKNWKINTPFQAFPNQLAANDEQMMASVFNLSPEERADLIRNLPPPDEEELLLALSANREAAIKDRVADSDYDQFMASVSGRTNEELANIIMKQSNLKRDELDELMRSLSDNREATIRTYVPAEDYDQFMDSARARTNEEVADIIMKQSIFERDELMSSLSRPLNRRLFLADLSKDDQEAFYDLEYESKKRSVGDSVASTDEPDERSESFFMKNVQFLFDNVPKIETMKTKPYIFNKTKTDSSQSEKIYLGPKMQYYSLKNGKAYATKDPAKVTNSINWEATLNLVIHELGNGARWLTQQAKYESSPRNRANMRQDINHIIAMIKQIDPRQGEEQESLSGFPLSSFDTPAPKPKQAPKISAEKKDFTYEPAGKGLVGRGLKGAGRPYNLADIEGSGRASDLKYKRIGTKFIRKADLNANRLKLVFPSRNSVGPLRSMSNELTEMVKDLLYNDNISQQAYRALSVEDQRVFYEIVQKTHVNHTLQTPMIDPRIELKAEFDKLRGEIALGNDNPDMLRELYRLATDMFEQKMITNKEFKSIMSALI